MWKLENTHGPLFSTFRRLKWVSSYACVCMCVCVCACVRACANKPRTPLCSTHIGYCLHTLTTASFKTRNCLLLLQLDSLLVLPPPPERMTPTTPVQWSDQELFTGRGHSGALCSSRPATSHATSSTLSSAVHRRCNRRGVRHGG